MKKFLKWFFIVLAILFVLYFIHSLITAKVYFNIYTAMKDKVESEDNFYGKLSVQTDEDFKIEQEVFIKDNTFVKKMTRTEIDTGKNVKLEFWQKYLPNKTEDEDGTGYVFTESGDEKGGSKFQYDPTAVEPENKMYRYDSLKNVGFTMGLKNTFFQESGVFENKEYIYSKVLIGVLKNPTILYSTTYNGEKCYAIKQYYIFEGMGNYLYEEDEKTNMFMIFLKSLFSNHIEYISKETKLPVGSKNDMHYYYPETYEYFTKEVTDEDIKLPNVEEYTLQEQNY